jgi:hypothetical protein
MADVLDPGPDDESRFKRMLEAGADIAGGASSAAAGLVLAGAPGAFAGAAAGPAVASVIRDVIHRVLSRREEKRVGGVFLAASAAYKELLANGEVLRSDNFFDRDAADRSTAEEVFERVVLAAKAEHQERKIPHMGYLMANVAFDAGIDAGLANWAITTAEDLTWTQYVLLSAIGRKERFPLPNEEYMRHVETWSAWGVHNQLADLGVTRREMVGAPSRKTERMALSIFNYNMRDLELRQSGLLPYHLLWLDRIPDADLIDIIGSLGVAPNDDS